MDEVRNDTTASSGLMDKLRNGAVSQLDTQKARATDGVGSVAEAIRQSTQRLRDTQHDTIAGYVEQAVNSVERFADRVKEKDVSELVRDAQQFARRNPALFIGAAFAAGIVGARFLKSSAQSDSSSRRSDASARGSYERTAYTPPAQTYRGDSSDSTRITPRDAERF